MYARLLIPTDGSASSDEAVAHGVALAQATGSTIVFLFVMVTLSGLHEGITSTAEALGALTGEGRAILDRAERSAADASVHTSSELVEGSPVDTIVRQSANFDLVIMGGHGRGFFKRLTLGSVTLAVLHKITRPLLIVRAGQGLAAPQGRAG